MKNMDVNGIISSRLVQGNGDTTTYTGNAADVGSMCPPRCGVYVQPYYANWLTTFANFAEAFAANGSFVQRNNQS